MTIRSYRDLVAWKVAMEVAVGVYKATRQFPRTETYGLSSQLQRAATSVASNIAEGHARRTTGEFLHFLGIALGSTAEVETQLMLALRLNYLTEATTQELLSETDRVGRLLRGLERKLTRWASPTSD